MVLVFEMYENLCRLCANINEDLISIFDDSNSIKNLKMQIHDVLHITVHLDDVLPTQVCVNCVSVLQRTIDFINHCHCVQKILEEQLTSHAENSCAFKNGITEKPINEPTLAKDAELDGTKRMETGSSDSNYKHSEKHLTPQKKTEGEKSNTEPMNIIFDQQLCYRASSPTTGNNFSTNILKGIKNSNSRKVKKVFTCSACKMSFSRKLSYEDHLNVHTGNRPFACKLCEASFRKRPELNQHSRTIHSQRQFGCSLCNYIAKHKGKLTEHIKNTHKKPFICSICGYQTGEKGKLVQHIANKHTTDLSYICEVCGNGFKTKTSLQAHRQNIHFPEPKICQICGIVCPSLTRYSSHIFRCSKEKQRYSCETCGQTYVNKEILRDHMNKHLNIKPYKCKICGKEFFQRNRLDTHKYVHRGPAYNCEICNQSFNRKDNMKNHMKKHFYKPLKCNNIIVTAV